MRHLKAFESWISNKITQGLSTQADTYSKIDRPENSKMIPKTYTGILCYIPPTNQYYIQIPNTEKKPYLVKGIPPAPDLYINLEPTEYFTEEDLSRYSSLSSIMTYGWEDKSGKWKDYTYKFFGYELDSDLKTSGVENILHITDIQRI